MKLIEGEYNPMQIMDINNRRRKPSKGILKSTSCHVESSQFCYPSLSPINAKTRTGQPARWDSLSLGTMLRKPCRRRSQEGVPSIDDEKDDLEIESAAQRPSLDVRSFDQRPALVSSISFDMTLSRPNRRCSAFSSYDEIFYISPAQHDDASSNRRSALKSTVELEGSIMDTKPIVPKRRSSQCSQGTTLDSSSQNSLSNSLSFAVDSLNDTSALSMASNVYDSDSDGLLPGGDDGKDDFDDKHDSVVSGITNPTVFDSKDWADQSSSFSNYIAESSIYGPPALPPSKWESEPAASASAPASASASASSIYLRNTKLNSTVVSTCNVINEPIPVVLPSALVRLAQQFCLGVEASAHVYHFRTYEDTFVGKEAVDYMVESNMALTREDAVFIGQRLMKELCLFHHVAFDHTFKDAYLFYRYSKDIGTSHNASMSNSSTSSPPIPKVSYGNSWQNTSESQKASDQKSEIKHTAPMMPMRRASSRTLGDADPSGNASLPSSDHDSDITNAEHDYDGITSSTSRLDLAMVAEVFRGVVVVSTHNRRMQRYHNTFLGSEAIDQMLHANMAETRVEAVLLGQRLLEEMELFHHVHRHHQFKDGNFLYRFSDVCQGPASPMPTSTHEHDEHLDSISSSAEFTLSSKNGFRHDAQPSKENHVSFDAVHTRVYEACLDVNPSTSSGPSIGLGWNYVELTPERVAYRKRAQKRAIRNLLLPRQVRERMLKDAGYSQNEIERATRKVTKLKNQRKETMNKLTAATMVD